MSARYDLVGDVHGMRLTLEALLLRLGWHQREGDWQPPTGRRLVFVGDLIDRGIDPLGCLELAETLVDAGHAHMVLGNHELNALHVMAGHRPREKWKQMKTTRNQIDQDPVRWDRAQAFLARVPTRLELDEGRLRVIHACWHAKSLSILPELLDSAARIRETSLTRDCLPNGSHQGKGGLADAAEDCIKGPEMTVMEYRDQDDKPRFDARCPWWERYPSDAPLVVFGHYKFPWKGDPEPSNPGAPVPDPTLLGPGQNAVCVDFGVEFHRDLHAFRYPEREFVQQPNLDPPTAKP